MLKIAAKSVFTVMVLFSFINANEYNSQDIIDVVDYKLDRIKSNLGSELHKIKVELEELKRMKSDTNIEQEITNLDKSISTLENNITKATIDNSSLEEKFTEYDNIISANNSIQIWIIVLVLSISIVGYFIINKFIEKVKEDISKNTQEILEKNLHMKEEKVSLKTKVNQNTMLLINKIELEILNMLHGEKNIKPVKKEFNFLRTKYSHEETSKESLLQELKAWIKTIEEKKVRKKVGHVLEAI